MINPKEYDVCIYRKGEGWLKVHSLEIFDLAFFHQRASLGCRSGTLGKFQYF